MPFITIRGMCLTIVSIGLLWGGTPGLLAQSKRTADENRRLVTPETRKSIERGLRYLADRQHGNGAFGSGGLYRQNVGVTAICGMAFLADGHTPGHGPYGDVLDRTIDFLLNHADASGFIHDANIETHGPMYGHGFAITFLSEVYGMTEREDLRGCIDRGVKIILNSQNKEGGWRYDPRKYDADISVTVCQVMALRAARNAGFYVPKETIDNAVEYIRKSQNTDGGFRYQLGRQPESAFARSAAAIVGLNSAGLYEGADIERGLNYVLRFKPEPSDPRALRSSQIDHFYYGHYYAAQAFWHSGGDDWSGWYGSVRDEIIGLQRMDGNWDDRTICTEYATAMACLVLEMPYQLMPILQK